MIIDFLCPECMGTTLKCYICNEDEKDHIDYIPCYDFEPCETCNGLGYIEELNETSD